MKVNTTYSANVLRRTFDAVKFKFSKKEPPSLLKCYLKQVRNSHQTLTHAAWKKDAFPFPVSAVNIRHPHLNVFPPPDSNTSVDSTQLFRLIKASPDMTTHGVKGENIPAFVKNFNNPDAF